MIMSEQFIEISQPFIMNWSRTVVLMNERNINNYEYLYFLYIIYV